MRLLIVERNLIWSARLKKSAEALGYEATIVTEVPEHPQAEVAIVNLGEPDVVLEETTRKLKAAGIHVLAHAGHKEADRLKVGTTTGCDTVVTNSELTFKLAEILGRIGSDGGTSI